MVTVIVGVSGTISNALCELLRDLAVSQGDLPFLCLTLLILQSAWCIRLPVSSVREERFIDFKQCLLVVNEKIKQIALVSHCEVSQLYLVLGKLRQSEETLLKFTGLL